MTNSNVLSSWKEIATYIGRGVRTVQRWEQELDLPVRRSNGKPRGAVIALKEDLDRWLRSPHGPQAQAEHNNHSVHRQNQTRLVHNAEILISRTSVLIAQSDAVRKQIARAISIGKALRISCKAARDD